MAAGRKRGRLVHQVEAARMPNASPRRGTQGCGSRKDTRGRGPASELRFRPAKSTEDQGAGGRLLGVEAPASPAAGELGMPCQGPWRRGLGEESQGGARGLQPRPGGGLGPAQREL